MSVNQTTDKENEAQLHNAVFTQMLKTVTSWNMLANEWKEKDSS